MKIKLSKQSLGGMPVAQWLRRAGYALIYDRHSGQESFSRRFSRDFYPRFHLYVQDIPESNLLYFNLHLDHKRASYEGVSRHSADYDGQLVEEEAARLRSLFLGSSETNQAVSGKGRSSDEEVDVLSHIKKTDLSKSKLEKKSFWQKIFS